MNHRANIYAILGYQVLEKIFRKYHIYEVFPKTQKQNYYEKTVNLLHISENKEK